ncbi:MAG: hypothetical protein HRU26_15245 [Psychroserpens sp.]|nr:hypothetical protein [Psychroserpens sp.]
MIKHKRQFLSSFIIVAVVSLGVLSILLGLHFNKEIPLDFLTRDITATGDLPVYTGFLSQLGILLWAATAAVCLFTLQFIKNKQQRTFLIWSFGITTLLGLDDAFLFHETVFPSLGIHQKVVFLSYALITGFYLLKHYKLILKLEFLLLFFALGCFAISLFIDNFLHESSPYISLLAEDISKFTGILFWLAFFAETCKTIQKSNS